MLLLLTLLLGEEPTARGDSGVLIRLGGQVLPAQSAAASTGGVSEATRIDLDFVDANLADVLRVIGDVAKLNFVLDGTVGGKVTVRMVDVPWDQALAAILQNKGLVAVPFGTSVVLVQPLGVTP